LIENNNKLNAIDIAFSENIREAKLFYGSFPKYKSYLVKSGYSK